MIKHRTVEKKTLRKAKKSYTLSLESRAIAEFYDSLTDEDIEDHARWGEFALGEFPM
jgi:hypothetical protein